MTTWQRIYSVARPEKKTLLLGMVFLSLSSGASLAFPQLVRRMMDFVLQPKNANLLTPIILALFLAFMIQAVSSSLRYYLFTLSGERIVLQLRKRLYGRLLLQDVSFFDFNRTGDLMSRLSSDCTTLQNTVSVNVSMALRNLGQAIGGFGFMFYTSWRLSAIMLLLIPPIALSAGVFGKKIRAISKNFQATLADASIVAEETISGVRTVKSFVQENREVARYTSALDYALGVAKKRIRTIAIFMTFAMTLGFAAVCFVLWYGGNEVLAEKLSLGDLTQFLLYLMIVAIGVGSLGGLWGDIMAGVGASQRIFEILEREPQLTDKGEAPALVQGEIEFRDVCFSYPSRTDVEVLHQLSFKIKAGQVVALVGSSGGGKSTVAGLMPRFYDPTSGTILLDGMDLRDLKLSWLREKIGIVSQEPVLISSTVAENILYGNPNAGKDDVLAAARSANILETVLSFPEGFETQVGEKGMQLSGGQKQRVAIARALLKDPKILILDEATSSLDTASEHLVQEALHRLMQGRTTLVIAHRLATIRDADQILVIEKGKIVQTGTHDELSKQTAGIYHHLLQRQFHDETLKPAT